MIRFFYHDKSQIKRFKTIDIMLHHQGTSWECCTAPDAMECWQQPKKMRPIFYVTPSKITEPRQQTMAEIDTLNSVTEGFSVIFSTRCQCNGSYTVTQGPSEWAGSFAAINKKTAALWRKQAWSSAIQGYRNRMICSEVRDTTTSVIRKKNIIWMCNQCLKTYGRVCLKLLLE